jgi:hypothetical protein
MSHTASLRHVASKLVGFVQRQAEREQRRGTQQTQAKAAPDALPLNSPYLIARGRRAEATFETPRTATQVDIREARKGATA